MSWTAETAFYRSVLSIAVYVTNKIRICNTLNEIMHYVLIRKHSGF